MDESKYSEIDLLEKKMSKIAFIFPGQGAQYIGMAKAFYDASPETREIFRIASEKAGYSMETLCFEENDRINDTKYTQPALLTACCGILKAVEAAGIKADMTAGLSLGEYSALVASGMLSFEDAFPVVCKRGMYMEEAVPNGIGSMAAVISRKPLPIEEVCESIDGMVKVANYNCPGQQVITGEKEAVEKASEKLVEAGAFRVVPLKVSGPFHSPMLISAGEKLRTLLNNVDFQNPTCAFVSNVTANPVSDTEEVKNLLGSQVCSSVLWQQSMEYMIAQGVDTFIEIGPGKTLSGFMKKIDRSVSMLHVETPEELKQIFNQLK